MTTMNQPGNKSRKWVGAAAILIVLSAIPVWYVMQQRNQKSAAAVSPLEETPEETSAVSCLGRIQPEDGVIHVAGPYIWGDSHAPRVESLKVKEGDSVRRGQALAVVGSSRVDLQACKLEYSIVSPK